MAKNVVIVGGGAGGGSQVAKFVAEKLPSAKVTLINAHPYAISRPTLPRMTVSDTNDLLDTALIPFDKLLTTPNASFVEGVVECIQADKSGHVLLKDGKQLPYDVLVLAPGSVWEGLLNIPDNSASVKPFIAESRAKFAKAQSIVLVGGGAVGVGRSTCTFLSWLLLISRQKWLVR